MSGRVFLWTHPCCVGFHRNFPHRNCFFDSSLLTGSRRTHCSYPSCGSLPASSDLLPFLALPLDWSLQTKAGLQGDHHVLSLSGTVHGPPLPLACGFETCSPGASGFLFGSVIEFFLTFRTAVSAPALGASVVVSSALFPAGALVFAV